MVEYTYIEEDAGLVDVVEACRDVSVIAIDTEFARFNTYYPIVGLIQIYTGTACFIIDPLPIDDLSPLGELLIRADLLKVFHACSEDMEVFQHAMGLVPSPVHDTQIAGAVLGVGFSMGYQAMVEHYLDISLSKDETRSDWLARPLSNSQLDYAALDVIHLLQVYHKQAADLAGTPKAHWVEAEAAGLGQNIPTTIDPETWYLKTKGLWQLTRRQLNQLKALCAWREVTARREDKPRNRVVDQKALMLIVRKDLNTRHELQQEADMMPRQVRKYGDDILQLLAEAKLVPDAECPELVDRDDSPVNSKKLKKLKQIVEARARELSVAPELLTKRRHLEKLLRSNTNTGAAKPRYQLPEELDGWRDQAIGQALLEALHHEE